MILSFEIFNTIRYQAHDGCPENSSQRGAVAFKGIRPEDRSPQELP